MADFSLLSSDCAASAESAFSAFSVEVFAIAPTDAEFRFSGSMDSGMLSGPKPKESSLGSSSESLSSPSTGLRKEPLVLVSTIVASASEHWLPFSEAKLPLPTE